MTCPYCGSEQHKNECFLGALGFLRWFRCRYCGGQWSRKSRPRKKNPEGA